MHTAHHSHLTVVSLLLSLMAGGQLASADAAGCQGPPDALLATLTDAAGNAIPMTYRLHKTATGLVLQASGGITQGAAQALAAWIQRGGGQIREVWLHSDGGNSNEGLRMGRTIRQHGLATRVPKGSVCFSACSMVFLGGVARQVEPGAYYGVHMWSRWGEEDAVTTLLVTLLQRAQGVTNPQQATQLVRFLQEQLQAIERHNAETARQRADYLTQMMVSLRLMIPNVQTHASTGHWLCPGELRDYNVVNMD